MKCARAIPALLAAGCSLLPQGTAIPGGPYETLSSAVFTRDVSVTQSVTISGKNTQQFLLQTEVDMTGLSMAGLTAFGQKLFELRYVDNTLTINETPFLSRAFAPEKLFADFQLIYWPGGLLRPLFEGANIEMLETTSELGQQRRFGQAGVTIIDIEYSAAPAIESNIVYRNLKQGYIMRIDVLSATPR